MSERKVLNKYYPPDFDPSKIPRLRLSKTRQYTVRLMSPCNMRCNTCGDYIAKGKKFNARKETVENESYLGLKVFRFYFKCPKCMQEITFKTDPKNMDYEVEHGATPNFKALKLAEMQAIQEEKDREEDEKLNPMKLLENRTKASRREMESIEALEDLKEMNQRQVALDFETILQKKAIEDEIMLKKQEQEDEEFVKSVFNKANQLSDESSSDDELLPKFGITFSTNDNSTNFLLNDNKLNTDSKINSNLNQNSSKDENRVNALSKRKLLEKLVVIKKKKSETNESLISNNDNSNSINSSKPLLSNLCAYSDSESDSQ